MPDAWDALGADTLHVTPTDDLVAHDTTGEECVCGPRVELLQTDHGDRWLVVHHALDGREANEADHA